MPKTSAERLGRAIRVFQLARALRTGEEHEDRATRKRARVKVSKWQEVLSGMANRTITVGSRTPVQGGPAWATLEVVTGGFATGRFLAGGELQAHERELVARVAPGTPERDVRYTLNTYYLSEEGLAELDGLLWYGTYEVSLPEEGALLVVAWLIRQGHRELADRVLDELADYLEAFRFYPMPTELARQSGAQVCVRSVGEVLEQLEDISPNLVVATQKEAVEVWAPLFDEMVLALLETVEGEDPVLETDEWGKPVRTATGSFSLSGGWPCRRLPEEWRVRAGATLKRIEQARRDHPLCKKIERPKENFAQLRAALAACVGDASRLTGREVGKVRLILASVLAKRGAPGSEKHQKVREAQRCEVRGPLVSEVVKEVVIPRLKKFPAKRGLEDLAGVLGEARKGESKDIPTGTVIAGHIRAKVERCLRAPVDLLVRRGIITSGDALARVLPQMTSSLQALALEDLDLRRLFASIYEAFRQRRSLLLLDLEKQVQVEELPWVSILLGFQQKKVTSEVAARQALIEVSALVLRAFPYAILPNKLIKELDALGKAAKLDLPFTEEIAADIFMGQFSPKFLASAKRAASMLQESLYARYYEIDYKHVTRLPEPKKALGVGFFGFRGGDPLASLCQSRAGVSKLGWAVAPRGAVVEQQQILTTHNLALLFGVPEIREQTGPHVEELAWDCFAWICRRHERKVEGGHANLIMIKNTAYAWRQAVFYLALSGSGWCCLALFGACDRRFEGKAHHRPRAAFTFVVWVAVRFQGGASVSVFSRLEHGKELDGRPGAGARRY